MQLRSNLAGVIARLERLQAGLPAAAAEAVDPKFWEPLLHTVARKELVAQLQSVRQVALRELYERLIEALVPATGPGLLTATWAATGVARYALGMPAGTLSQRGPAGQFFEAGVFEPGTAAAAQYTGPGWEARGYAVEAREFNQGGTIVHSARQGAWQKANLEAVRATIRDWVLVEKQHDARDAGLSEDAIAERVQWIMGVAPGQRAGDQSPAMREIGERLAARMQEWLDGEGQTPPTARVGSGGGVTGKSEGRNPKAEGGAARLDGLVVGQWLAAVRAAWVAYIRLHLPGRVAQCLAKLNREIKAESRK